MTMTELLQARILPAPEVNAETRGFWDAAREGRYVLPLCRSCGRRHWYPRALCPYCFSDEVSYEPASGRGVIYSFTVMRREVPVYVLAYVALDEGPTVMTNIVGCDPDALSIGQRVQVDFASSEDGPPIPIFRPARLD